MGTIVSRRRKDGSLGYTAQIRIHRQGKCIHSESETFDRRQLATEWMRRREAELDQQRARGEPLGKGSTVAELLDWYGTHIKELTPWGRTKEADLKRLIGYEIASKNVLHLSTADYIAHVEARRRDGAGPATANNDLIWLRGVFRTARGSLGLPINLQLLEDASHELRRRRVIGKPKERQRRVTPLEEKALLDHFAVRDVRAEIPMADIIRFALATARRQEEITRLRWADLDRDKGIAWLDDVKHPRKKVGNRRAFRLLSEAWELIDRQPKVMAEGPDGKQTPDPRVFPYNPRSIGANFTRACRLRGLEDLRFHDLRHEATSRLFERGYDIPEVAQFTLHESWTTLKRYTHLRPEHVVERPAKASS
ncbi:integrase [Lysobacteraceae bacterium NML93-0792]|nr:integrase [Xanthomonadaceae bacterium NML93-0792]PBS14851.1 integrase [Xanthomonadaceae bacterium NML93-0793]PBS17773.1 integrase [Xanthomonadaceae bacterium NML93-0831]